jgi:glycosyltransferase involved in cell wall biosynthesis
MSSSHQSKKSTIAANPSPLVSIGCAVYNGAETLKRALDSLVLQDYPSLEIIICDDGSTDDTREICRDYAKRFTKIRYIENEENIGLTRNYNKLFNLSNGKYFLWADQDDVREPRYVSMCVAVLESDEDAVLCHSHTGVIWKVTNQLIHIVTIDSIEGEPSVLKRYWRFLRRYSDTAIYGLIRSDELRKTGLCKHDVAFANSLLFELLMLGKFRQVPETLYYYYGKGYRYRTSPEEDYSNSNPGRSIPKYRKPFLVVVYNQSKGILTSIHGLFLKFLLLVALWVHFAMVNGTKAAFRLLYAVFGNRVPKGLENFCSVIVWDNGDIRRIVRPEECRECYPEGWPLLKKKNWKFN